MRSYCLHNGNYVDIAEIYEVRDGKQINIPEKLRHYRALSNNRELLCSCGCGAVVVLVAGDKNLRRQHFRLLHNFANACCEYQEESELSIKSKIMLKCWLSKSLPEMERGIQYRVPISRLVENKRRFELSMYSEDYDIGIIYNKYLSNILEEKVDLLSEYMKSKIIYVTRIENEETGGQYPEHMMRVQEAQGYCFYLDMTVKSLYEEVVAKVSFYGKTYNGIWEKISVCNGKLDEFGLRTDGSIIYKGEPVSDLVAQCKKIYQEKQEYQLEEIRKQEEAERLRQEQLRREKEEAEQLRQEQIRQEQEEHLRIEEERRKQKELEEKKVREARKKSEEEEFENYVKKYPKYFRIYNMLNELKSIQSEFVPTQNKENERTQSIKMEVDILMVNREKHCIEIAENNGKKVHIYILENDFRKADIRASYGVPYKILDYTRVDNVETQFQTAFICIFKKNENGVRCSEPQIGCQYMKDGNMCVLETNCKYQER